MSGADKPRLPTEAVRVAVIGWVTLCVVTLKLAVVWPGGTVTLCGTVIGPEGVRLITCPDSPAGPNGSGPAGGGGSNGAAAKPMQANPKLVSPKSKRKK